MNDRASLFRNLDRTHACRKVPHSPDEEHTAVLGPMSRYGLSQLKCMTPPATRVVNENCTCGFITGTGQSTCFVFSGVGGGVGGGVGAGVGALVKGSQNVGVPLHCRVERHVRSSEPMRKKPKLHAKRTLAPILFVVHAAR